MPKLDEEILTKLRQNAYRTIRILRMIEQGHRDVQGIAIKTKTTPQLVNYYFKLLKIK